MKLALGTVQFGMRYGIANESGQVSIPAAREILLLARHYGIDLVDTAISYGDSEARLGKLGISGFRIVTKLPGVPKDCQDVARWAREQVAGSLARFSTPSVYGLLLHRSADLAGATGKALATALEDLRSDGVVTKIGVSIYSPEELEIVTQVCRIDLVQAPCNLIDRRLHVSGWMGKLKDMGVEIHARSAFLQGLLLMPGRAVPSKFSRWQGLWEKWDQWLAETHCSALQGCISFPCSFPEIDRVIVGVDNKQQLTEIVNAAMSLPPSTWPDISCFDEQLIIPANWSLL